MKDTIGFLIFPFTFIFLVLYTLFQCVMSGIVTAYFVSKYGVDGAIAILDKKLDKLREEDKE